MDSLTREREAKLDIERSKFSLSDELERVQRDLTSAKQQVKQHLYSFSASLPLWVILVSPFKCSH